MVISVKRFCIGLLIAVLMCSLMACGKKNASSAPHSTPDGSQLEGSPSTVGSVDVTTTAADDADKSNSDTSANTQTGSHIATEGTTTANKTTTETTTKSTTQTTTSTTVAAVQLSWSLPIYEGGTPAQELYDCGGGKDMGGTSQAQMLVISNTTREQFDAYLAKMKKVDYKEIARNTEFENVYVQYYRETDKHLVYIYFLSELGEVRIIEDKASVSEPAFEYTCTAGDVTVYQYAFMQDGQAMNIEPWYEINGMFYIIRLADNRLICVDGATAGLQATQTAATELWRFMQEITGSDKVRIACWYITHPHGDHYGFLQQLLQQDMADKVTVERVMYNFNNPGLIADTDATALGRLLAERLPNALYLKPHTGQKITLGNVDIDVLFTHEDYVDPTTGETMITQANNVSTIVRVHLNGRTMLLTGDWSGGGGSVAPSEYPEGMRRLLLMHTNDDNDSNLKSDILQISHHGLNTYTAILTSEVAAEYAFVPAPDADLDTRRNVEPAANVRQFVAAGGDSDQVYFTNRYTYALHISRQGKITVAAEPIRGVDTGDDPKTAFVEEDYRNITLKKRNPYRVPTEEELSNWKKIHL